MHSGISDNFQRHNRVPVVYTLLRLYYFVPLKVFYNWIINVNAKFFPSHTAHRVAVIFVSLALSQTSVYTASPRIRG